MHASPHRLRHRVGLRGFGSSRTWLSCELRLYRTKCAGGSSAWRRPLPHPSWKDASLSVDGEGLRILRNSSRTKVTRVLPTLGITDGSYAADYLRRMHRPSLRAERVARQCRSGLRGVSLTRHTRTV